MSGFRTVRKGDVVFCTHLYETRGITRRRVIMPPSLNGAITVIEHGKEVRLLHHQWAGSKDIALELYHNYDFIKRG